MVVMVIRQPTHALCVLILTALLHLMTTGIDPVFEPNIAVEELQLMAAYLIEIKKVVHSRLIANNQTTSKPEPVNVRIDSRLFTANKFLGDVYGLLHLLFNKIQPLLPETKFEKARDFLILLSDRFGFVIPEKFMSKLESACQICPMSIPPDRFAWLMAITCAIVLMRPDFSIYKNSNSVPKIAPYLAEMLKECDQTDITFKQLRQIYLQLSKLLNLMFSVGLRTLAPLTMFVTKAHTAVTVDAKAVTVNAKAAPANNGSKYDNVVQLTPI